jgi:hypothetical protein
MTDVSLSWPLNKQGIVYYNDISTNISHKTLNFDHLFHSEGKTARDVDGHCHVFLPANHVKDPVTGEWYKTCACGLKEPLEML